MTRNQAQRADQVIDEFLSGHLDEEALEEIMQVVLEVPFVFTPEDDSILLVDRIRGYTE